MKGIKYIILGGFLFVLSCNNHPKQKILIKEKDPFHLLGKQVSSIDSILPKGLTKVVLLFNYYDCGSCVDSAFTITKKIDSICGKQRVFIVSTMGDSFYYQNRNSYYEYIYTDQKDLIRKELKYVQTPILFQVNSINVITDYILPNVTDYEESSLFIHKVCGLNTSTSNIRKIKN